MIPRFVAFLFLPLLVFACVPQPGEVLVSAPVPVSTPLSTPPATPAAGDTGCAVSALDPDLESGRLLAPTATIEPPQRFQPTILRQDAQLQRELIAALGSDAQSYAFVVKDLRTGRGAAFNAGRIFYAASLYKLFVMYEVYHQEAEGLLALSDPVTITPYYDAFGLGPRLTTRCQTLTVDQALKAMIGMSDNAAAVLLQDLVGSANINRSLEALGLRDSRLLPEELPLTAADVALILEAIGRGRAVSQDASQQMLNLLATEQFDNGLRAGLPGTASLAHKTGNWTNAIHDAGLVFWEGGAYLITVLSEGDHGTRVIEELSLRAYTYFAGKAQP